MKQTIKYFALLAITAIVVIACKDNFSEADFVNNQLMNKNKQDSVAAAKQVAALNASGQLLSYTLQVLDDKVPLAGVAVVMSNPPEGSTATTLTATTDANGFATFRNVQIGANTFIISRTGYYSATFIADFGAITVNQNYTIITNATSGTVTVVPIKRAASNQVPMFASAAGGATATIRGNVTIETDLTNTTPEIPQNLTIRANLAGVSGAAVGGNASATAAGGTNQATISTYFFNTNAIGTAVVDNTTGAYSMVVPAGADGRTLSFVIPTVNANQRIGFTRLAGQPVTAQISSTIPAVFGPDAQAGTYDAIPTIAGANAVFSPAAPPAPGTGLTGTFAIVPRSLTTGNISVPTIGNGTTTIGNITYQLSKGSGYNAIPQVTISGGGGSTTNPATANARMRGFVSGNSITAAGSGYTGTVNFELQIFSGTSSQSLFTTSVNVGGTATGLTSTNAALPTSGLGLTATNPFITNAVSNTWAYRWIITGTGTGATATPAITSEVHEVEITSGGSGFTSPPTISIAAPPSGGTTATVTVTEFATQWTVAMNNTASANSYRVLPAAVQIATTFGGVTSLTSNTANVTNIADQFGTTYVLYNNSGPFNTILTVANGNVVFSDNARTYNTLAFSSVAPTLVVTPVTVAPALGTVAINSTLGAANFGQVGNLTITQGAGYNVPVTVAITPLTGLAGSGASYNLAGIQTLGAQTRAYTFTTAYPVVVAPITPGSGYQPFANMYYVAYPVVQGNAVAFSGPTTITVRTGDVIVRDIVYGTGRKITNVN